MLDLPESLSWYMCVTIGGGGLAAICELLKPDLAAPMSAPMPSAASCETVEMPSLTSPKISEDLCVYPAPYAAPPAERT